MSLPDSGWVLDFSRRLGEKTEFVDPSGEITKCWMIPERERERETYVVFEEQIYSVVIRVVCYMCLQF